ncbi:AAA family ATPase [Dechloromonas sp. ZY10]|uniref:Lon protease family protein n=1 Tax=Dechloromonas aquae TaxID=2664436 RepID=UPI003527FFBD
MKKYSESGTSKGSSGKGRAKKAGARDGDEAKGRSKGSAKELAKGGDKAAMSAASPAADSADQAGKMAGDEPVRIVKSDTAARLALPVEKLRRVCTPEEFGWQAEWPDSSALAAIGEEFAQPQAVEALRFGLGMRRQGFNLFVIGEPGDQREAIVRRLLAEESNAAALAPAGDAGRSPLRDWCYVNNFQSEREPRLLSLPLGRGRQLRDDMRQFVGELGPALAAAFDSDEYRQQVGALRDALQARQDEALRALGREAAGEGIALVRSDEEFSFMPLKDGGEETMGQDEFDALPAARQQQLEDAIERFDVRLHLLLHEFPRWRRETQGKLKAAAAKALQGAVGHLIEELQARYGDLPEVVAHLQAVEKDIVEVGENLHDSHKSEGEMEALLFTGSVSLQRYLVNLLVDRENPAESARAAQRPVVFEDHPTFQNLVGRVEHIAHLGTLVSNFMLIKPGALHRANGGTLLLDADHLLTQPYAWEGLKRLLKAGEIRIESLGEIYGMASTQQLQPQHIPLDVKLVLFGDPSVYYLLAEADPEFPTLFKVVADFDGAIERTPENVAAYARLLATLARREGLRPLAADGLAAGIEQASRLIEDNTRLTTGFTPLVDLLIEADWQAGRTGLPQIGAAQIAAALAAREARHDRARREYLRAMLRDELLIATSGEAVGHINALAAVDYGGCTFGHPSRLTATVALGDGETIDIEREVDLGGPIHSKGMLILSAFVAARYGRNMPLAFKASLVFEQSYGEVEGDSASLAELCVLLSALSSAPIKQTLAMTGSVNQYGSVQPIGAVNEKIEGFFDLCRARGLQPGQGVIIPAANVAHLMLRPDVVAAVAAGEFAVHAVSHVDEALEILTGIAMGQPDEQGAVAPGTLNHLVVSALLELTAARHDSGPEESRKARAEAKPAAEKKRAPAKKTPPPPPQPQAESEGGGTA